MFVGGYWWKPYAVTRLQRNDDDDDDDNDDDDDDDEQSARIKKIH